MPEDAPFDNVAWEKENWTLAKAKKFAGEHNMQLGKCDVCKRPHLWQIGRYTTAPATCGRDACLKLLPV